MNLESVETRNELIGWTLRSVLWVHHKKHVGEACAEIGSVRVVVSGRLGGVDVHTFRTIQLDHCLPWNIAEADWKHLLIFTIDARTVTEVSSLVFLDHLRYATVGQYITCVDQTV